DVKPDNILLDLASGRALVSDVGIARGGSGTTTGPRRVVGTAEFMSPEQVLGERVDPRSDLYSLGVVGFFALSGELPFVGPDDMSVLARHVSEPPPPLASVAPDVPPRLAATIDRCLAKDPGARFPNGEALAAALAAALDRRAAVAVRAFVTEARQLSTAALLYGAFAAISLPLLAIRLLGPDEPQARLAIVAAAVAIAAVPLAVMVARVRRLRKAGYGREDLVDALRAELSHRREELAFLYGDGPSRLERASRLLCYVCVAAAAGIVEPPRRFGQHLFRLTKREPHQPPAQLRAAEKARARHRRHADLLGEPIGELVVRQLRDAGAVRQHIVGALGRGTAEAGVHQCPAQEIPPGPVLVSQPLVVVVPQGLEADGHGLLEGRRRSHGQKVVHLTDGVGRVGWGHDCPDAPTRDAERLRRAADRDRALAHPVERRDGNVLSLVIDVLVDLIRHGVRVVAPAQLGDRFELAPGQYPA